MHDNPDHGWAKSWTKNREIVRESEKNGEIMSQCNVHHGEL